MITRLGRLAILTAALTGTALAAGAAEPPAPYGPVPSERQLAWHGLEYYGFIHFTVNTFTGKEWGYGDEPEATFNPTDFDADQMVRTARDGGMKGLILTCKHHDGFCLWPSQYTEHSVKNSPWRNGKGDVVRAVSEACHKYGLKFGVYLSPWDRNRADYGTPAYLVYYRNQLRELLTNYGPLFEVWFDGANGGDGYYGGAREKRTIPKDYYGWKETWKLVHDLQPQACIFSGTGADVRWVGNEHGQAPDPCWDTLAGADFIPSLYEKGNFRKRLGAGDRPGSIWQPAECDVSIRPGWFYHAAEDAKVKTPAQLTDLYFVAVGHGTSLLLNLPPDRRGQIATNDVASLLKFHRHLAATFGHDLAQGATITASNVRGGDTRFAADRLIAGQPDAYWTTDDGMTNASVTLEFKQPVTFNIVRLREYLPLGQRVEGFGLDRWQGGQWVEFATGTSIGSCRMVRGQPATTDKVRLRITDAPVGPALAELGLFQEAAWAAKP